MKINNIINGSNKVIVCVDEDKIFYSIKDAAAHYGITRAWLSKVLSNGCNKIKNHTFRYATEEEIARVVKDVTIQEEADVTANGTRTNGNCDPVMCISEGMYFASMTDAAEHYGVSQSQISYACKAVGRTAGGNTFCKISDLHMHLPELREAINKSKSYDLLVERENMRKEIVAKIDTKQEEVTAIEFKMNEMAKQLADAKASLEMARVELQNFN